MTAAAPKVTATFWDCGGVLLTNGWDHGERHRVLDHFGLNRDEFEPRHKQANDEWERGEITLHDYLQKTVFYAPRSFSEDEFIHHMQNVSQVLYPRMIEFARALNRQRATGDPLGVYMLSNESRELMAYRIEKFGLTSMFDAYLVSSYLGWRKPGTEIYLRAMEITARQPSECVLIDDREENVAAACKLGMHGIHLETPEQTIGELQQLGICIPPT